MSGFSVIAMGYFYPVHMHCQGVAFVIVVENGKGSTKLILMLYSTYSHVGGYNFFYTNVWKSHPPRCRSIAAARTRHSNGNVLTLSNLPPGYDKEQTYSLCPNLEGIKVAMLYYKFRRPTIGQICSAVCTN